MHLFRKGGGCIAVWLLAIQSGATGLSSSTPALLRHAIIPDEGLPPAKHAAMDSVGGVTYVQSPIPDTTPGSKRVTVLTTETFSDFVGVRGRTTVVVLFDGLALDHDHAHSGVSDDIDSDGQEAEPQDSASNGTSHDASTSPASSSSSPPPSSPPSLSPSSYSQGPNAWVHAVTELQRQAHHERNGVEWALVDVSIDRMMATLVPSWTRDFFLASRATSTRDLHVMVVRGVGADDDEEHEDTHTRPPDGLQPHTHTYTHTHTHTQTHVRTHANTRAVVLQRWTGKWGEIADDVSRRVRTHAHAPLVHEADSLRDLATRVVSAGDIIVTARTGAHTCDALRTVLHKVVKLWAAKGWAVDQPQSGTGDLVLPTLVLLPPTDDHASTAALEIRYSMDDAVEAAAVWEHSLDGDADATATDIMRDTLSHGAFPLVVSSIGEHVAYKLSRDAVDEDLEAHRTRYLGFLRCPHLMQPAASPAQRHAEPLSHWSMQSVFLAYRRNVTWYCTPTHIWDDREEFHENWSLDILELVNEEAPASLSPMALIVDSRAETSTRRERLRGVFVYGNHHTCDGSGETHAHAHTHTHAHTEGGTGEGAETEGKADGERVTGRNAGSLNVAEGGGEGGEGVAVACGWANPLDAEKLSSAVEYMMQGDAKMRSAYRKEALELASASTAEMIDWALRINDVNWHEGIENRSYYDEDDVDAVLSTLSAVNAPMELRKAAAAFFAQRPQTSRVTSDKQRLERVNMHGLEGKIKIPLSQAHDEDDDEEEERKGKVSHGEQDGHEDDDDDKDDDDDHRDEDGVQDVLVVRLMAEMSSTHEAGGLKDGEEEDRDSESLSSRLRDDLETLAKAVNKRDRLCVSIKRAEAALQRVLWEVNATESDAVSALGALLDSPVECTTFSGIVNETQALDAMRLHGPSGIQPYLTQAMRESAHRLLAVHEGHKKGEKQHGKASRKLRKGGATTTEDHDDSHKHVTISVRRAFKRTLKEVQELDARLKEMYEIGHNAAKDHQQGWGRLEWETEWPIKHHHLEIPRLDASTLTMEQFRKYAVGEVPMIITGLNMTPNGAWDVEYLKENCGSIELDVGDVKRRSSVVRNWGGIVTANLAPLTLADLLTGQAEGDESMRGWYLVDSSMQNLCAGAFGPPPFASLQVPRFIAQDYYSLRNGTQHGYPSHWPSAFCGAYGTGTAIHEDYGLTEFWMHLQSGEKHWRMFRPRDRFLLYHEDELSSFGPDVFNVDLNTHPLAAYAEAFEVRQQAGDLVFIPAGVIHGVRNTGAVNCGVTTNYMDESGLHFGILYHLVADSNDVIRQHLERYVENPQPTGSDGGVGGTRSDIRMLLNAWAEQVNKGVEAPLELVMPYGVYRSQSRRFGRDTRLYDRLNRIYAEQKVDVVVSAA